MGDAEQKVVDNPFSRDSTADSMVAFYSSLNSQDKSMKLGSVSSLNTNSSDEVVDFDSNPQAYIQEILKTSSLNQLIEIDSEITKEIKSLENEMKEIVYSNYNKFISASSMINQMRNKFNEMKEKSTILISKTEKFAEASEFLTNTSQSESQKFRELHDLDENLDKFKNLVGFPIRLKLLIKTQLYSDAVEYYKSMCSFIEKYKNLFEFALIEKQSLEIIGDLIKILTDIFYNPKTSMEVLGDMCRLLLDLGQDPQTIQNYYIQSVLDQLLNFISKYEKFYDLNTEGTRQHKSENLVLKVYSELGDGLTKYMEMFRLSYVQFFSEKNHKDKHRRFLILNLDSAVSKILEKYSSVTSGYFYEFACSSYRNFQDGTERVDTINSADSLYTILKKYEGTLDSILGMYWNSVSSPSIPPNLVVRLKKKARVANAFEYINSAIGSMIGGYIDGFFSSVRLFIEREIFKDRPESTYLSLKNAKATILLELVKLFEDFCKSKISRISNMLKDLNSHSKEYALKTILNRLKEDFLDKIFEEFNFENIVTRSNSDRRDTVKGSVESSNSSYHFHYIRPLSVILIFETLGSSFLPLIGSNLSLVFSSQEDSNLFQDIINNGINKLYSHLGGAEESLLSQYIHENANELNSLLRPMFDTRDWTSTREPSSVGSHMFLIHEELMDLKNTVLCTYEQGSQKKREKPLLGSVLCDADSDGFNEGVNSENCANFDSFSKVSDGRGYDFIMSNIIQLSLEDLLEVVKSKSFSVYGYQQIQLDANFLNIIFERFVCNFAMLDHAIERIVEEAKKNCSEPIPLSDVIMAKLCHDALTELKNKYERTDV